MITLDAINWVRTGPRHREAVLLLHPVGLDLTYWGDQIEALCYRYDVLALDLPGHGRSSGSTAQLTFDKLTALLQSVVRIELGRPAHVVGLSVGGMLAQHLAIASPELVSSVTLMDTAATFSDEVRSGLRARANAARVGGMAAVLPSTLDRWFTAETRLRRPDLIERVTRTLLADDADIHGGMWDMISDLNTASQLSRITCPALVVVGEHDPSTPPAAAELIRDGIPRATLHVVEQASHMAPLERPDVVNQVLLDFLVAQSR